MRRAAGQVRFLPADLLGWPLLWLGAFWVVGVRVVEDRAADGIWTVRVVVPAIGAWLDGASGWVGAALCAAGLVLIVLAHRLGRPRVGATAVRYPLFSLAARMAAFAWLLSSWRAFTHVVDTAPGGLQWRFLAESRDGWANDLVSWALVAVTLGLYALSFGRRRWSDLEREGALPVQRQRVPATATAATASRTAMAAGVATQRRSLPRTRDETGT